MAIKKIEKTRWGTYFDTFSKTFLKDDQPEYAEIRVLSEEMGVQPETQWMPLKGISYDQKGNILDIDLEELNRMIINPVDIYVDQDDTGWLTSIEVIESDGTKNIIEIR